MRFRVCRTALIIVLLAFGAAEARPLAIKTDARIESDAGVTSVATCREVLYASSVSGSIYRWTGAMAGVTATAIARR